MPTILLDDNPTNLESALDIVIYIFNNDSFIDYIDEDLTNQIFKNTIEKAFASSARKNCRCR